MTLLYFQPGTDSRGAAAPCPDGVVSGKFMTKIDKGGRT